MLAELNWDVIWPMEGDSSTEEDVCEVICFGVEEGFFRMLLSSPRRPPASKG